MHKYHSENEYAKVKKVFIDTFINQLKLSNLSFFLGAGVSVGAGFPSWEELLEDIANDIGIDLKKETDYYRIFQYCVNELSISTVEQRVYEKLSKLSYKSKGIESALA